MELAPQPKGNGDLCSCAWTPFKHRMWSLLRSRKAMVTQRVTVSRFFGDGVELAPQPKGNGDHPVMFPAPSPDQFVELAPQPKGNGDLCSCAWTPFKHRMWSLLRSRKAMVTQRVTVSRFFGDGVELAPQPKGNGDGQLRDR